MIGEATVKVENGKLVHIEIEYENEIKDVSITGDFFIEPPEALESLEKSLEGMDIGTSKEKIVFELGQVDADLIGFSAEDVAEAVKEATRPDWRIVTDKVYSESMHHALDEVLTKRLSEGDMPPTIRFLYRDKPAVPIGRFQSYSDEVNEEYVGKNGIDVVRRITGGETMYAEPGTVITYSIYIPRDEVPEDVEESYETLDKWAVEALRSLGLDVEHKPLNDIEHPDGKVGGSAQLRKENAVLHHTMMSYDLDTREMLKTLRIGEEKVLDKTIESAEKRVAVMADYIDDSMEEVIETLIEKFKETYGGQIGSLTEEELDEAEKLSEEKFDTEEWNKKL